MFVKAHTAKHALGSSDLREPPGLGAPQPRSSAQRRLGKERSEGSWRERERQPEGQEAEPTEIRLCQDGAKIHTPGSGVLRCLRVRLSPPLNMPASLCLVKDGPQIRLLEARLLLVPPLLPPLALPQPVLCQARNPRGGGHLTGPTLSNVPSTQPAQPGKSGSTAPLGSLWLQCGAGPQTCPPASCLPSVCKAELATARQSNLWAGLHHPHSHSIVKGSNFSTSAMSPRNNT